MFSCEPIRSYKVPLKSCGQSVIEHNLVTIYLSLDWPDNAGDNPNLVIHVRDKKLPQSVSKPCKTEATTSYFPLNQSSPSLLVNSVHHQQNLLPTYHHHHQQQQQQQQNHHTHQQQHHSSAIDLLGDPPSSTATNASGDHNDVSSTTTTTTTTVVFGTMPQEPHPPHTSIQQIKTEPKTQLSPLYRRHPTPNSPTLPFNATCSSANQQQYLPAQHVIQTPPSNSDPRSAMQMSPTFKSISPTASTPTYVQAKQTSPVMTHVIDLQQAPAFAAFPLSTSAASTVNAVVCTCLKPNIGHEHSCPALMLTNQCSVGTVPSTTVYRPTSRDIAQAAAAASQMRTNRALSMTPIKTQGQSLVTAVTASSSSSSPFLNCNTNLLKTTDLSLPSTGVATIVSQQQQQQQQQQPFVNNTQLSPTIKVPRVELDNNPNSNNTIIHQQSTNFPSLQPNTQSNYQTNPPAKKAIARQRSVGSISAVPPRPRRKRVTKQSSLHTQSTTQEQTAFHTSLSLNDPQQHAFFLHTVNATLPNSPSKQPPNISSLLTSSIQVQQQMSPMYMMKEEARVVANVPLSTTIRCQTGDTKVYTVQPLAHMSTNVAPTPTRSPVKLPSPFAQNSVKKTVSQFDIDQTIDDVVSGKGSVSVSSDPPSLLPPHPPSSQMVWIQNGTTTTTTWLSPLQKQQQQPAYDPNGSTLSHQDVVNIAQQVVFPPSSGELNKMNTISQQQTMTSSKKRNRSKSTTNITTKRIRSRKAATAGKSVTAPSSQQESTATVTSPITPTLNLINKPIAWSDSVTPSVTTTSTTAIQHHHHQQHSTPIDKNDLWHTHCVDNVDAMLDAFQLVSDEEHQHQHQRTHSHQQQHTFDFDLSVDGFSSSRNSSDRFSSSTPPPPSFAVSASSQVYATSSTLSLSTSKAIGDEVDVYEQFLNPPLAPPPQSASSSSSTWQENQVTSSVSTPPDLQTNNFAHHHHHHQHYSQVNNHLDALFQAQTSASHTSSLNNSTMFNHLQNNDFQMSLFSAPDRHHQQHESLQKVDDYGDAPEDDFNEYLSTSASSSNSSSSRTVKRSTKVPKSVGTPPGRTSISSSLHSSTGQKSISKPTCTRCGTTTQQVDITHHEFPAQKGLLFECMSCGNNSMKSNVSDDERHRRIVMAAADHLSVVDCHFCGLRFHSNNDYLLHLRNDHGSNTPMQSGSTRASHPF